MARPGVSLPPELKQRLAAAIGQLGTTQVEIARDAGVSQGFVSNLLSEDRRVKSPGKVLQVIEFLRKRIDHRLADAALQQADAARITLTLDELGQAFGLSRGSSLAAPGPPVPQSAKNYIHRPEHDRVVGLLQHTPFTATLMGPPGSGKSTLLNVLAETAEDLEIPVAVVDLNDARMRNLDKDEFPRLASLCVEQIHDAWDWEVPIDQEVELISFGRWLVTQSRGKVPRGQTPPRRLLMFDSLDRLNDDLAMGVALVMRLLTNERARGMHAISILTALGLRRLPLRDVISVSALSASEQIDIGWFEESHVRRFAESFRPQVDEEMTRFVWEWFRGQPSLTHAAFDDVRLDPTLDASALKKRSLAAQRPFDRHVEWASSFVQSSPGLRDLLRSLLDGGFALSPLTESVRDLEMAGLIRSDIELSAPAGRLHYEISSEFYRQLLPIHLVD